MAITNYAELLQAVSDYVDGAAFDGPTMVALTEADFRRQIVAAEQELTVSLNPSTPTLPADLDSIRSLSIQGASNAPLQQVATDAFYALPSGGAGQPSMYALTGSSLLLWPTPDQVYAGTLVYRQRIPPLSNTNPSNWLLAAHPDAYLFGAVLQAEFFGWNDARLPLLQAKLAAIIDDINHATQRKRHSSGPLIMQAPNTDNALSVYGGRRFFMANG